MADSASEIEFYDPTTSLSGDAIDKLSTSIFISVKTYSLTLCSVVF